MSDLLTVSFLNMGLFVFLGLILWRLCSGLLNDVESKVLFIFHHVATGSALIILLGIRLEHIPEIFIWASIFLGISQAIVLVASSLPRGSLEENPDRQYVVTPMLILLLSMAAIIIHFENHGEALLTWESEVSRPFTTAFQNGETPRQYFLERLVWDEGLVSTSHRSFLYGAPTYALMYYFGFTPFYLRLVSVFLGMACSIAFWILVSTYFKPRVALFASTIFALHPVLNYYSNYGVSLTGTFLSLIFALFFVFRYLDWVRISYLSLPLAVFLFYLATLGYSPGRMSTLIFLAMMGLGALVYGRHKHWSRVRWYAVFLVACTGTYFLISQFAPETVFYNARGEQLIGFLKQPCWIDELQGRPCTLTPSTPGLLLITIQTVLEKTTLELGRLLHPLFAARVFDIGYAAVGDPPTLPLYHTVLFPFLFLGVGYIVKQWKQLKLLTLPVWIVLLCLVVLLTTRVDIHRLAILIIPISLIAAIGLDYFCVLSNRPGKPWTQWAVLTVSLVSVLGELLFRENLQLPKEAILISDELTSVREPVVVGFQGDHTVRSWLNLLMTERNRELETGFNKIILDDISNKLAEASQEPQYYLDLVNQQLSNPSQTLLVLAPAQAYAKCAQALKDAAYTVEVRKDKNSQILFIHKR